MRKDVDLECKLKHGNFRIRGWFEAIPSRLEAIVSIFLICLGDRHHGGTCPIGGLPQPQF